MKGFTTLMGLTVIAISSASYAASDLANPANPVEITPTKDCQVCLVWMNTKDGSLNDKCTEHKPENTQAPRLETPQAGDEYWLEYRCPDEKPTTSTH